jgi:hypothetical protein
MKPAPRFTGARFVCLAAVFILALAANARAEVTPWDQAKVTALAQQLEIATNELNETFRRQPVNPGSMQSRAFYRLRHEIRNLRRESRSLARSLQNGAGHDETLPSFTSMMQTVAAARDEAPRVFSSADVAQRADATLEILKQISPYYDTTSPQRERVTP